MGNNTRTRVPGPLGQTNPAPPLSSILRNLKLASLTDKAASAWKEAVKLYDELNLGRILSDIYSSDNWPREPSVSGNVTDPANARLPSPGRERDATRPTQKPTFRLKDPKAKLKKVEFKDDEFVVTGSASATLEIPTAYPLQFDSPINIDLAITSTSISASELGLTGRAKAFGIFRADFDLHLHYKQAELVKAITAAAGKKKLTQAQVAALLDSVNFDASAVIKAGLPLSFVSLSASSLLPLSPPLLGAQDRLLPPQISALPDSRMFIGGTVIVPPGVAFETAVPGLGAHYSNYGRKSGYSATVGAVVKPSLKELGSLDAGKILPVYGYLDLRYVRRVSETVDLGLRIGYTYAPGKKSSDDDALPPDFLGAKAKPWLDTSRENVPPEEDTSGHKVFFRVEGTMDWLGGR